MTTSETLPIDPLPVNPHLPTRPSSSDPFTREEAAAALSCKLANWARVRERSETPYDATEYTEDARFICRLGCGFDNGYEVARNLEGSRGYFPDASLVEILDDVPHMIGDAHRTAVRSWVSAWSIRPTCAVGAAVAFRHRGQDHIGEIVEIDQVAAKYSVFCEALGHERDDKPVAPGQCMRTTALILKYNEVTAIPAEKEPNV